MDMHAYGPGQRGADSTCARDHRALCVSVPQPVAIITHMDTRCSDAASRCGVVNSQLRESEYSHVALNPRASRKRTELGGDYVRETRDTFTAIIKYRLPRARGETCGLDHGHGSGRFSIYHTARHRNILHSLARPSSNKDALQATLQTSDGLFSVFGAA